MENDGGEEEQFSWFDVLPDEIVVDIFSKLSKKQDFCNVRLILE